MMMNTTMKMTTTKMSFQQHRMYYTIHRTSGRLSRKKTVEIDMIPKPKHLVSAQGIHHVDISYVAAYMIHQPAFQPLRSSQQEITRMSCQVHKILITIDRSKRLVRCSPVVQLLIMQKSFEGVRIS
jgi:hypothetical protein